ncbi:hypothetical protein [Marinisporobacter balticus]|uniref:Uncharacterized protein n=1 Tax=Marinisporobacter balticus TaxID=2018667 RepID=A0A4R2KVW9_9FIRM|nr:hypothetical protein [Marinisporobacter balticus]TCO74378.1 hypothetical protein EV214_11323 [Marinisporobacter balticus]
MQILEKIIVYFIECFLMVGAGLGLIGIRPKVKTMLLISIIQALLVYNIRILYIKNNIPFGTHTLLLLISFIILLKFIGKQRSLDSIIATLISFLLIMWGDGVFLFPLLRLLKLNPQTLMCKHGGLLLAGLLANLLLIITFFIGYILKITIIDFNHFHENNE